MRIKSFPQDEQRRWGANANKSISADATNQVSVLCNVSASSMSSSVFECGSL